MKQFVVVLVVVLFLCGASSICRTPHGETGSCISLFKCPILLTVSVSDDPIAIKFIQESACGSEKFMICCGSAGSYIKNQNKTELFPYKGKEKEDLEKRKFALEKLLPNRVFCGLQHTDDCFYTKDETSVDEFPWMVYIPPKTFIHDHYLRIEASCVGVLISSRYILTHKGCNSSNVIIGQHHIYKDVSCIDTPFDIKDCTDPLLVEFVEDYIISETSNFALLRLERNISFSDYIRPICLPMETDKESKECCVQFWLGRRTTYPRKFVWIMDVLNVPKNIVKQEIIDHELLISKTHQFYDDLNRIKQEVLDKTEDIIDDELCIIPAIKIKKEDIELNAPVIEKLYIKDESFTNDPSQKISFNCELCEKKFKLQSELVKHIRSHTGEKPFECRLCPKKFALKISLQRHMKIHIGLNSFKCKLCSKRYSQKSHLEEHTKTHTGEKPFGCKLCTKKFIKKSNLKQHMKVHTGEKPFECNTCMRQFSLKCHLNEHLLIHNGEKPFECYMCRKRFSRKSTLKKHLKTHTGERPFECQICSMRFAQRSSLQRHLKAHARKT